MSTECYLICLDTESPVPLGRFDEIKAAENSGIRRGCENFIVVTDSLDIMSLLTGKDEMSQMWKSMHPDDPEWHLVRFSRRVEGSERLWQALQRHNFNKQPREFKRRKNVPLSTTVLGVLEQGEKIDVVPLAQRLGVDRSRVMNAINSLRQQGLKITRVEKGIFVLER